MNYFVYNGVSSLDMGLRIESKNVFSAPEYDVTFQSIPGRNGDLILPNGRYPNIQVTLISAMPGAKSCDGFANVGFPRKKVAIVPNSFIIKA